MINFNTPNALIFCYPADAGGKFLANCIGLSDDAVLQNAKMAEQQLLSMFSQNDKIHYIENEFEKITNTWTDLHLDDNQLFGIEHFSYFFWPSDIIKNASFHSVVDNLSNSNKKFALIGHTAELVEKYLKVWPNAKVIYFINCLDFINFRTDHNFERTYNLIKGSSWPSVPTTIEEYYSLDEEIRKSIEYTFNYPQAARQIDKNRWTRIQVEYHELLRNQYDNAIIWDTNNYFSEDKTVEEIKKIYNILNLSGFNEEFIRKYYNLWINKLTEIRK